MLFGERYALLRGRNFLTNFGRTFLSTQRGNALFYMFFSLSFTKFSQPTVFTVLICRTSSPCSRHVLPVFLREILFCKTEILLMFFRKFHAQVRLRHFSASFFRNNFSTLDDRKFSTHPSK